MMSDTTLFDFWPELAPVRGHAAEGRLTLGRCTACGEVHHYPRALCPFCLAPTVFEAASGLGVIYSLSVSRRGPKAPSVLAYVTLDEGPSVLGRIVDCDVNSLSIGQRVASRLPNPDPTDLSPSFTPILD